MATDTFRLALMLDGPERGWSDATSSLVALAVFPLDDQPQPSRSFEKVVRKSSRRHSKFFRKAADEEAASKATELLASYRALAIELGETYYAHRYDKALGLSD